MNRPKGNHKHLTLSQRIEIKKALLSSRSFSEIARIIGKDYCHTPKQARESLPLLAHLISFHPFIHLI